MFRGLFRRRGRPEPIRSDIPATGLTTLELAVDLVSRIDRGHTYARIKKRRFRASSSWLKLLTLALSAASTIILGLQNLDGWTALAFSLVAVLTVLGALEPFFAWRSRWILMEEASCRFHRLRDEVTYYVASCRPDDLDPAVVRTMFERYQTIWDELSERWLEHRRSSEQGR